MTIQRGRSRNPDLLTCVAGLSKDAVFAQHSEIPDNYRCPLCSDHQDHDFVWDELAEFYVCLGCSHEINNGFDFPVQPTFAEYNCADTVERLLALMGISYEEARRRYNNLSGA